jgi:hypothetical protein
LISVEVSRKIFDGASGPLDLVADVVHDAVDVGAGLVLRVVPGWFVAGRVSGKVVGRTQVVTEFVSNNLKFWKEKTLSLLH